MSYNKTVNASVNIMFHGLINPCIHLMESHQLYNIVYNIRIYMYIQNSSNEGYVIVEFKLHKFTLSDTPYLMQCCKKFSFPTISSDLKLCDTEFKVNLSRFWLSYLDLLL
jgi:hypothetical protein